VSWSQEDQGTPFFVVLLEVHNMRLTEYCAFRLTADERQALETIAASLERRPSDVLRRLVRAEAKRRGLLKNIAAAQKGQDNNDATAHVQR
jgi:hypothetical protein